MPLGLDPNDPRVRSAGFAEMIRDFWRSDIGAYMARRAREASEEATRDLVEGAHQMTHEQIRTAQARIWQATKFGEWLEEAYAQGCADLQILEEEIDGSSN